MYENVGDYSLPLDHFVLVHLTSDTRGYHGVTCGSGDDHVVRLAALIGRTWFGWRDVWGPRGVTK